MPPHFLSDRWLNTHGALRWWKSAEKRAISNNLWCSSTDGKIYAVRDETHRKRCEILYSHNISNMNLRFIANEISRSHRNFTKIRASYSQENKVSQLQLYRKRQSLFAHFLRAAHVLGEIDVRMRYLWKLRIGILPRRKKVGVL